MERKKMKKVVKTKKVKKEYSLYLQKNKWNISKFMLK